MSIGTNITVGQTTAAEQRRDNTQRLYMAMTRAGQRLVLTYVGEPPPMLAVIPGSPRVAVV